MTSLTGTKYHYEACPKCRDIGRDNRGDNLAVYRDSSAHCFSCGYHRSPTRFVVPVNVKDDHNVKVLPADFSRDIPARGWKWLLQYGIGYKYWKPFVGWSEQDSRLVFTVGKDHTDFSIGRYIPLDYQSSNDRKGGNDEVGPEVCLAVPGVSTSKPAPWKWFFYGEGHQTAHVFGDYLEGQKVVLVEDIVSAHKVGLLQPCICLFGTSIFPNCIPVLRHIGLPITIWLDADQQGVGIIKKAANLSILSGLPTSYVFTDKDPKCLSFDQIKGVLDNE